MALKWMDQAPNPQ